MRWPVLLFIGWSATALAQPPGATPPGAAPTPALTPVNAEEVPEACRDLAKMASSPSKYAALSARISLASCLADHAMKPLVLCDCEQSVHEIEEAAAPSLALLDEVFAAGDATTKILARHARGEMLSSFVARMLATVPPPPNGTSEALALRDLRLDLVQPLVEPWRAKARSAHEEVDRLAKAHPQLAKNQAIVAAVRTSRDRLAQGVAKR